ncbi:DNA replication/repair protein RecF [Alteromonas sediminis]|uniref:DNA replication and repair protein RecF n=1 Tax=Alteromonas sediminis TaxID=2259342 RepID=A0A3N5XZL6_9ALTE|nr:DNA replication/repair protein RecF [Alteromonas sediminis]RPJ66777.1 DNA replication/repair protein RecF [Alteromonas sediminis]
MQITHLELTQFRNFHRAKLEFNDSLNVFIGINGSGKSSLIESLYFFGYGRSFRTSKSKSLIGNDHKEYSLYCRARSNGTDDVKVGVARSLGGEFRCQVNGEHGVTLTDMVTHFPIQLFTPQSTDLIIGSPSERRRFLDWTVFHVEHSSKTTYRKFSILHKQRNALLKQGRNTKTQLAVWDEQFIDVANQIDQLRCSLIGSIKAHFDAVLGQFLPEIKLEIEYNAGWDKERGLRSVLKDKLDSDYQYGSTAAGPHKADLRIKLGKTLASEVLSRGQLRMAVAALQLAQTKTYNQLTGKVPIFLLDDLGAELDEEKRELFLDALVESKSQVFVTAIELQQLGFIKKYQNKKMFHVEHGSVKEE